MASDPDEPGLEDMRVSPGAFCRKLRNDMPTAEEVLWNSLHKSGIGFKFSRQLRLGKYFPDFCCRSHRLVVEIDGESHLNRVQYDADRDAFMAGKGYKVLRFTNEQVQNHLEWVLNQIRLTCESRPQFRY